MNVKKVLITGLAGFLGSNLARYIKETHPSIEVEGWDNLSSGLLENVPEGVKLRNIGLGLEDIDLEPLLQGVDIVYHFASYESENLSHFLRCYDTASNQIGSYQLINGCINVGTVKRLVYGSSMSVYGVASEEPPIAEDVESIPNSPFAISQKAIEHNLMLAYVNFGLDHTVLRLGSVYGPHQCYSQVWRNPIANWMYQAAQKQTRQLVNPNLMRPFVYVDDVLPAIWRAATEPQAGRERINLDGNKLYKYREVCALLNHVCGGNYEVTQGPTELAGLWGDCKLARDMLGYSMETELEEGVTKMWKWVRSVAPRQPEGRHTDLEVVKNLPKLWQGNV